MGQFGGTGSNSTKPLGGVGGQEEPVKWTAGKKTRRLQVAGGRKRRSSKGPPLEGETIGGSRKVPIPAKYPARVGSRYGTNEPQSISERFGAPEAPQWGQHERTSAGEKGPEGSLGKNINGGRNQRNILGENGGTVALLEAQGGGTIAVSKKNGFLKTGKPGSPTLRCDEYENSGLNPGKGGKFVPNAQTPDIPLHALCGIH